MFWDGSFVFHAGVGVVCCMMDELTLRMINSNNMVSGTNPGGAVFFNVSDLFGASRSSKTDDAGQDERGIRSTGTDTEVAPAGTG